MLYTSQTSFRKSGVVKGGSLRGFWMFSDTLCNYSPPGTSWGEINKWTQSDFSARFINIIHLVVAQSAFCLCKLGIHCSCLLAVIYFFVTSVFGIENVRYVRLIFSSLPIYTNLQKQKSLNKAHTVYCGCACHFENIKYYLKPSTIFVRNNFIVLLHTQHCNKTFLDF